MAKHWRDQFRHNPGAKASEEERRVEKSEGWEESDPGEKGVRSGGTLRMGERAARPSARPRPTGKPTAQVGMRVRSGAQFEIAGREAKPVGDAPASSLEPAGQLPAYLQKHVDEVKSGAHAKAVEAKKEKLASVARQPALESAVPETTTPEQPASPAGPAAQAAPEPKSVLSKIGSWFGGKR